VREGKQKSQVKEPTNTPRPKSPPPRIRYGQVVLPNGAKVYGSPSYLRGVLDGYNKGFEESGFDDTYVDGMN